MSQTQRQMHSLLRDDGVLQISLREVPVPEPGPAEVLVRIDAAPINPSDLGLLFGAADMQQAQFSGTDDAAVIEAPVSQKGMQLMAGRIGQ